MGNATTQRDGRMNRLAVVAVLLFLSLITAVVLFYFLDSFAQVENKGVSLGGAAAGFVVIFVLLRSTYFKESSVEREWKGLAADERILALEAQVEKLITSKLDNFIVQAGYKPEISKEFYFGFCYPDSWEILRYPKEVLYGSIRDLEHAEELGFARNLNVIIVDISEQEEGLDDLYEGSVALELYGTPDAKQVFKERILFQGLDAMRHRLDWEDKLGQHLTAYQIIVADRDRNNLFKITFTTVQEDFDASRTIFDNIASTFRL